MPPRKKPQQLDLVEQANALATKPGCCEEASTLSHKSYIPCNRPAVAIVAWTGRPDKPIRMCDQCEFHNVKNRGGYRVEAFAGASVQHEVAGMVDHQMASPIGHNSEVSDDALIAENFILEDQVKAGQAKFDEWAEPSKTRIAEIESEISRRLLERKADSTKTDSGTAYFSDIMSTKIVDVEKLFDFLADNWQTFGADVKVNIPIGDAKSPSEGTVRGYMDNNGGKLPPGITNSFFKRLNLRRT